MTTTPLRGLSLPFRFERGGLATSTDDQKLRENLVAILLTDQGERPMRRGFGGGLRALVHEPLDAATMAVARHRIAAAVAEGEPRIQLRAVRLEAEPSGGTLLITLAWVRRETCEPGEMTVPLPWSNR